MISWRSFRSWPFTEPYGATLCIGMPLLVFSTDMYSRELTRKICYNLPHDDTPWPKDFLFDKRNLWFMESKTLAKPKKITLWNWRIFWTLKYLLACSILPIGATWLTDRIRLLYFEKTSVDGEWPVLYRVGDVAACCRNSSSAAVSNLLENEFVENKFMVVPARWHERHSNLPRWGTHHGFVPLFEKHTKQYCHSILLRMVFC